MYNCTDQKSNFNHNVTKTELPRGNPKLCGYSFLIPFSIVPVYTESMSRLGSFIVKATVHRFYGGVGRGSTEPGHRFYMGGPWNLLPQLRNMVYLKRFHLFDSCDCFMLLKGTGHRFYMGGPRNLLPQFRNTVYLKTFHLFDFCDPFMMLKGTGHRFYTGGPWNHLPQLRNTVYLKRFHLFDFCDPFMLLKGTCHRFYTVYLKLIKFFQSLWPLRPTLLCHG